uniref:NADH dehydrogenase subunit 4L n=1 Tax=Dorymyrmex brunneus TaxID=609524 RepID=A0A343YVE4_9HYME|nr:NADH dehydrogenase subunit 4L [Dorymyrmex brunneus]
MYVQIFFMSMVLLMLMYKYMLVMLLFLEIMVVNISVLIFILFSMIKMEFYLIYYLIFSVCESVLGMTLLVLVARFSGNEYYSSFNLSKF